MLPYNQTTHTLDNQNKIVQPVYVPDMFADVIVALATQTAADDKTAQFVDATAWVPKQMRLNFKKIQEHMKEYIEPPGWVAEIKTQRAKGTSDLAELGRSEAMAAAFQRIGFRGKPAPGEPPGGLADAKPIDPGSAPKWDAKKRGLEQPPRKHIDDPAKFVDGKTNRTRLVGTWARFETGSEGRSKTQLHRWCICDESKAERNNECATYPGHFASTQGGSINSNAHPNQGKDGCSFENFKPDPAKAAASSAKGKGKGAASAATSDTRSTVAEADLKRAAAHIENLKDQLQLACGVFCR